MRRKAALVVPSVDISAAIHWIRGERVMLDADLARLYHVPTKRLNEQVARNRDRFPRDFMFQLTAREHASLRSQIATSNSKGGRRTLPYAFTEQGVAMLSSVLHSKRAIRVNLEVMRAFVQLRRLLATHAELSSKLATLERKYDGQFRIVFDAIRELMAVEPPPLTLPRSTRRIGFGPGR
jgi:hypothetical protein